MKQLLPLGSVVRLNDSENEIMIYGRIQKSKTTGKVYDYVGCIYPYGITGNDESLLFEHSDINEIYYVGYQDIEELHYRAALLEEYEKRGKKEFEDVEKEKLDESQNDSAASVRWGEADRFF